MLEKRPLNILEVMSSEPEDVVPVKFSNSSRMMSPVERTVFTHPRVDNTAERRTYRTAMVDGRSPIALRNSLLPDDSQEARNGYLSYTFSLSVLELLPNEISSLRMCLSAAGRILDDAGQMAANLVRPIRRGFGNISCRALPYQSPSSDSNRRWTDSFVCPETGKLIVVHLTCSVECDVRLETEPLDLENVDVSEVIVGFSMLALKY
ncbi:hypothetical protein SprV_0802567600 [Sparganum proliferum]